MEEIAKTTKGSHLVAHAPIVVCDTPTLYTMMPDGEEPRPVASFRMPMSVRIGDVIHERPVLFITADALSGWIQDAKKSWTQFQEAGVSAYWREIMAIRSAQATAYTNAVMKVSIRNPSGL